MSVTTLPFMEVVELYESARAAWFRIDCQLCDYQTFDGALHVCEEEAQDHLRECHPRRLVGAYDLDREIHLAVIKFGFDGPEATALLDEKRSRGI